MAKPEFSLAGSAAAWGDLAETTEPMLGNLFAVSIRLPAALRGAFPGGGAVASMLASAADVPEEVVEIAEIPTKLSTYDVVVGKTRGELSLTFKEQVGAPITNLFAAWHKLIVDARNNGIGFPADFRSPEIWVTALTGDGAPFFFWGHKGAFPKAKGKPTFGNDVKTPIEITIPFSYIEILDIAETLTGEGANFASRILSASQSIGI